MLAKLFISCLLFMLAAIAKGQEWQVPAARYRVVVDRDEHSPWPASTGCVLLWPNHLPATAIRVRMYSASGKPVKHSILWQAAGEPLKVLFDCSAGDKRHYLYYDRKIPVGTAWRPESGLVLETRSRLEGAVDTLEQVKSLWQKSTMIFGKSLVSHVFHGMHLHGPSYDFISHYSGFFTAPRSGRYRFATISDDASFLLVNGKSVTQWPGWHGVQGGRRGQYCKDIKLTAGRHRLDYWHVQSSGTTVTVAAWQPPEQRRLTIMPPEAFVPVARFYPQSYHSNLADPLAGVFIEWQMESHTTVDDLSLTYCKLRLASGSTSYRCRWLFDDGETAQGKTIQHLFLRPALRTLELQMFIGARFIGTRRQSLRVHPCWQQRQHWSEKLFKRQWINIMARSLRTTPALDLEYLLRLAYKIKDRAWIAKIVKVGLQQKSYFTAEHAEMFYQMAQCCLLPELSDYRAAERSLQRALDLAQSAQTKQRARLDLARIYIDLTGQAERGEQLMSTIVVKDLSAGQQRRYKILQAELLLQGGKIAAARGLLLAAGGRHSNDHRYVLARRFAIEKVKDYCQRGEYLAAEVILQKLEQNNPLEKLSSEIGMLWLHIHLPQKRYATALGIARKLLFMADAAGKKAQVLLALSEIYQATGQEQQAVKARRQLWQQYPYSEAAAIARQKWPGG